MPADAGSLDDIKWKDGCDEGLREMECQPSPLHYIIVVEAVVVLIQYSTCECELCVYFLGFTLNNKLIECSRMEGEKEITF